MKSRKHLLSRTKYYFSRLGRLPAPNVANSTELSRLLGGTAPYMSTSQTLIPASTHEDDVWPGPKGGPGAWGRASKACPPARADAAQAKNRPMTPNQWRSL